MISHSESVFGIRTEDLTYQNANTYKSCWNDMTLAFSSPFSYGSLLGFEEIMFLNFDISQ